jgi:4a-hydroxytetrahydrobiopterin dehydratase
MNQVHAKRSILDWIHNQSTDLIECKAWSYTDIQLQLSEFNNWLVEFDSENGNGLVLWRQYSFENFKGVKLALQVILNLADEEDHHPEVTFGFNRLKVLWSTHSANGITNKDWACAAKLDYALKHIG